MSIRVTSKVWQDAPYSGSKLLVLLALSDFANDEGWCWPAMKTVARYARCTETYARQCIREFEADGVVAAERSRGRFASTYRVLYAQPETETRVAQPETVDSGQPETSTSSPTNYMNRKSEPSGQDTDGSSSPTPDSLKSRPARPLSKEQQRGPLTAQEERRRSKSKSKFKSDTADTQSRPTRKSAVAEIDRVFEKGF